MSLLDSKCSTRTARMQVLGLIPARGGSKGIPRKNIRPLHGCSLVERAYQCAIQSKVLDRIVLSTDDPDIAKHGREIGVEVPFIRPSELAEDASAMLDVVFHCLSELRAKQYQPDLVILLQPTAPLRRPRHIIQALELLGSNDSVCSVYRVPQEYCPHFLLKLTADGYLKFFMSDGGEYTRRQDVPQAYKRDGTIYLTRTSVILEQRSLYGDRCVPYVLDPADALAIDTETDWKEAELRLSELASAGSRVE